ncbi:MAG: hypothetical protein R2825_26835 [Saprospiraceae bacterium]
MKNLLFVLFINLLIPIHFFGFPSGVVCPSPTCSNAQSGCIVEGNQIKKVLKFDLSYVGGCTLEGAANDIIKYVIADQDNVPLFTIETTVQAINPQVLISPQINQLPEGANYKIWNESASGAKANFTSDFLECSTSSTPFDHVVCCDSPNLIQYTNFEQLASSFPGGLPNDYGQEKYFSLGSISPGEYALVNSSQAANVNPNWQVKDHSTCNNNGKILLINGQTGQNGSKMVWKGSVANVKPNKEYRFCANFKNLSENNNDIKPKISIKFSGSSEFDIINEMIDANLSNSCEWQAISKVLTFPTEKSLTVWIYLDETGIGSGNDLAIDDISFQEMPSAPPAYVYVAIQTTAITSTYYTIHADPVNLPVDWPHFWEVCQLDNTGNCIENTKISNPSQWFSTADTEFKGYLNSSGLSGNEPGQFLIGTKYKIKFATWTDCNKWSESTWTLEYNTSSRKAQLNKFNVQKPRKKDMIPASKKSINKSRN